MISGVATGWHGWTMSRGPGVKRAPEKETKKQWRKEKKRKETKKEKEVKEGTKLFKYPDGVTHPIYPHESKSMTENTKIKHWLSSHDL